MNDNLLSQKKMCYVCMFGAGKGGVGGNVGSVQSQPSVPRAPDGFNRALIEKT